MRPLALSLAALLALASEVASAQDAPSPPPPPPKPPKVAAQSTTDAPKPRKSRPWKPKKKKTKEWLGPVANYPGFQMLDGGGSRVLLEIDRHVDVSESKSQGRLVYHMRGVQAPTRTNRLPLLTGFFATPVSRIQVVEDEKGGDVDLVIELRQASESTFHARDTDNGMVIQVDFPKVESVAPPVAKTEENKPKRAKRTTDTTKIDTNGDAY